MRPIGGEGAGVVADVGANVANLQSSDLGAGLVPGSLRSRARVNALYVARMETSLSFTEAVTLPVVWTTAAYSFREAGLGAGQRVLIHAAAGGVGLVSVEMVLHAYALVYATAGAKVKHSLLRRSGVHKLATSRNASASEFGVAQLLCGERTQMLITALSNDFVSSSFALLSEHAIYIEIGKNAIWSAPRAEAARIDVVFLAVAVDEGCRNCPGWNYSQEWFRGQLQALTQQVKAGHVSPLLRVEVPFEDDAIRSAFRLLQKGKNLGKVVVCVGCAGCASLESVVVHTTEMLLLAESGGNATRNNGSQQTTAPPLVRLSYEAGSAVAIIELNDPLRFNTLSSQLGADMRRVANWLRGASSVRATVLCGAGTTFCAGGNPYAERRRVQLADAAASITRSITGFVQLSRLPFPVLCAVHGRMVGGAAAIFLQTDYRVSETEATFQHGNLSRGVW